jgi:predicted amidohydrolase YtcJ
MPGFIEVHGHPLMEAVVLSDRIVDIRPVTMRGADDVVDAVHREVTHRGPDGACLLGWDALLQPGLPEPTLAWLDEIAPDSPLVIIHNSGHKAFFNSVAAQRAGLGGAPKNRAVLRNFVGGGLALAITYAIGHLVGAAIT